MPVDSFFTANFMLSPDGKWIVFRDDSDMKDGNTCYSFYALPVNAQNPLFIGKPVLLGKCISTEANVVSTTWMNDAAIFVAADDKKIYKWDLSLIKNAE